MPYDNKTLSVSELNSLIKESFKQSFFSISIEGEISSFKPSQNGHWYFTLKDKESQISAVMFKFARYNLSYTPQNGDYVVIQGSLDVYVPRGSYQIICQSIMKKGSGDLQAEIEKRKAYYQAMGYFDLEKKKPIPAFPSKIGIVTAATGAAIQDMLDTLKKRAPSVDVVIYPTLVQGESAAENISLQIENANNCPLCDVLIVGRGGGSIEDLLPFSDPLVIEAIFRSEIPIISAVGHEVDYALSDYVADIRAITPTEGAAIASEGIFRVREQLKGIKDRLLNILQNKYLLNLNRVKDTLFLSSLMHRKISNYKVHTIDSLKLYLDQKLQSAALNLSYKGDFILNDLQVKINKAEKSLENSETLPYLKHKYLMSKQIVELCSNEINSTIKQKYSYCDQLLSSYKKELGALSPKEVLKRGYTIIKDDKGKLVKQKKSLRSGDVITLSFVDGNIKSIVKGE